MSFKKSFNSLLNEILTEYQNAFGGEITQGSVMYVKSACLASMLWGLYQSLDHASRQAFITTADRENIIRHAAEYGITNTNGKSEADIIEAVLNIKQGKFAGGNRYDYEAWAREVEHEGEKITFAKVIPLAQGEGTFDIIVMSNKNHGEASPEICTEIYNLIQDRRPVGTGFSWGVRVLPIIPQHLNITITYSGELGEAEARVAIVEYINELPFGAGFSIPEITRIVYEHGVPAEPFISVTGGDTPNIAESAGIYNRLYVLPENVTFTQT